MRTAARFLIAALLALVVTPGRSDIHTIADITGTGATVQIATTSTRASWIQIIAPSTNSAVVRFGDSTVSVTRGLPIAAGGGYCTLIEVPNQRGYNLSLTYVYVAVGDKASIAWGD